jgi:rod shape determining protein RodA
LFFAYFFAKYEETINTVKTIVLSVIFVGIPLFLIYKQPDNSTTILTALIFAALLFISGLSYKIIMPVLGVSVPIVLIVLSYIYTHADALIKKGFYPATRIMSWLDPTNYADTAAQQRNSIWAIGSGQLFGKGLNNSVVTSMKNTNYIIEPQTDFIFAVAGEELGFIGTISIIILLLLIVIECILIARKAKDTSGKLICCGMGALIGFQAFINLCVATGLMPNTGMTLPFVSYGLTSLVSLYMGMGIVLNVGLQPKKYS